jgi:DNA-binding response OmpR family regulator
MSKQISALMLSSDEGLWERYCKILEQKNYVILLLSAKQIERCKQAIREQDLIILDIPDDKKEWIEIVKTIRKILGEKKPLLVVSNLEGERVTKILNAGASDYMRRLENEEPFVAGVTNLMKRYQLNQRQ